MHEVNGKMSAFRPLVYSVMLLYAIICLAYSSNLQHLAVNSKAARDFIKLIPFRYYFFTLWALVLQICFLSLAVIDEIFKLTNRSKIQRLVEKIRQFLFSALVFPSSLLVTTFFWSVWHYDRELIFPKALDDFYPAWLNHTVHTFAVIPLMIEIFFQFTNKNYSVSRIQAGLVLTVYATVYKILYLSVYFQHGIWIYSVYKIFSWPGRVGFILLQFFLMVFYQQIGISLLSRGRAKETKAKLK